MYVENPKTKGSGILCCIPQAGECPLKCPDCFFQSGRSYLEPLEENLPNMPTVEQVGHRVVRVNDGNDSSNHFVRTVREAVSKYPLKFYNTSFALYMEKFNAPFVLTVNPGSMTDVDFQRHSLPPNNLMFVRVRVNTWNLDQVVDEAVRYYTSREVPVVLTFMAYYTTPIPESDKRYYAWRMRTLNDYWAITTEAWRGIMKRYEDNVLVYSCGKIEGEQGNMKCSRCGNCIREFYNTLERMNPCQTNDHK